MLTPISVSSAYMANLDDAGQFTRPDDSIGKGIVMGCTY